MDEKVLSKYNKNKRQKIVDEYDNINKHLNKIPTVFDILELSTSFKDKCMLMEQLDILINMDKYTSEYVKCKNKLISDIEKFGKLINGEEELEKELINISGKTVSLKSRILNANLDKNVKATIYDKYIRLQNMDSNSSEYSKLNEWIEYALALPTSSKPINLPNVNDNNKTINNRLYEIQQILNEQLYGMDNVKEEILLVLNNKISNNSNIGNALALLGKPGTGKTCIVRTMTQALGIPFVQISLGGLTDASYLDGHGYTYEGAMPGVIVRALIEMKCNNGIIFFDEVDKLSESDKGKEVAWNLLHITDFAQNNDFRDKYLCDIPIDLSKIWFIYSMNDDKFMDKALRDRLPVINVDGYQETDKIIIAKNYMIPKILKNLNMNDTDIIIENDVIQYIISKYSLNLNSGVRELDQILNRIFTRINLYKNIVLKKNNIGNIKLTYKIDNFKLPLQMTNKIVDQL